MQLRLLCTWSAFYHCLLFKASTNLQTRLSSGYWKVVLVMGRYFWGESCSSALDSYARQTPQLKSPHSPSWVSNEGRMINGADTHHSIASSSPVPLVAEVLNICHLRSFRAGKPRAFAISVGVMACSMSCLFAKTTKMAFFNSSSWKTKQGGLGKLVQTLTEFISAEKNQSN